MTISWDFDADVLSWAATAVGWFVMLALAIRRYRTLEEKPAVWKMMLAWLAGLMALSFHIPLFDMSIRLAVVPLGVGALYLALRNRSWRRYRYFAWVGFWGNYIFAVLALLSALAHGWIYPPDQPSTYIAKTDEARIVAIHPSGAANAALDREMLKAKLEELQAATLTGMDWHLEARKESHPNYRKERFPYLLLGTAPSWGSGIQTAIYVEGDGHGLLITTAERHYYYRSDAPLLEWRNGHAQ